MNPLIAALPRMSGQERARVEELFEDPEPDSEIISEVIESVDRCGGLDDALENAREAAARAREHLAALPDDECVAALRLAVDYAVDRER